MIQNLLLVLTTVATRADADALARAMVEQRLAACAQISAIDSVYWWQGAVQAEGEFRLLFKTTAERYPALEAALRAAHPYELPAIVALPVAQALPAFADWVGAETRGDGDAG
ncbi:divalent-cation tolerance protein CutA [Ottowia sp.]|uniref:divalent-cation tolerance protein CutA n=1 Tax=Ottowia sp. TaxID=1898956 RepID=UPI002BA88291|nr:divalent-cation tolerance protein CutA [Ottowia sp.]HOB67729.1 divalent-cation tolerance protein CutA [Ottowia sp.]HPZ55770.1 divalent-cation tolerance protein CutA [Ottowia sp.]HQD46387.1 divalent-cation tolerance protein CutA [Ottowia sp.]